MIAAEEKAFGADEPRLVASLNTLAVLDYGLARYAEAKPLFKQALAILEKEYGTDSAEVTPVLNNLAALYNTEGHSDDALALYQRVPAIKEKSPAISPG
jgi:tetratricopeptide (TPR) repeat protein